MTKRKTATSTQVRTALRETLARIKEELSALPDATAPAPPPKTAARIAERAAALVSGDRAQQHGDKRDNFLKIVGLWNAYLRNANPNHTDLLPEAVGDMMELMKVARRQSGAFNEDDYVDAAGYAACAFEVRERTPAPFSEPQMFRWSVVPDVKDWAPITERPKTKPAARKPAARKPAAKTKGRTK